MLYLSLKYSVNLLLLFAIACGGGGVHLGGGELPAD